jgi:putative ABC transport system permease protein
VFAGTLVGMRFLPLLLRALAWIAGLLPGVALVTALRFLSRTPGAYGGPALLVALTLALATFTSSMALTLDRHSEERAYYRGAADVRLVYPGAAITSANIAGDREIAPAETSLDLSGGTLGTTGEADTTPSTAYMFVQMEEYLTIPGVTGTTRVAPSKTDIIVGNNPAISGIFYGVDRTTLAAVLADAWRPDYADESLGALMNRLADYPDAALVSETFAIQQGLRIGNRFTLAMNDRGQTQNITFTVVGTLRYFPTLYDQDPPFVIGNLDYSFDSQGGQYPYEVWLSLAPDAGLQTVAAAGIGYGLRMIRSMLRRRKEHLRQPREDRVRAAHDPLDAADVARSRSAPTGVTGIVWVALGWFSGDNRGNGDRICRLYASLVLASPGGVRSPACNWLEYATVEHAARL